MTSSESLARQYQPCPVKESCSLQAPINIVDSCEPQKEVVKKETIKLLDAGVIYPISDSNWVRLVDVVPKKRGITVVKNDKDELIPMRTVTGHRMCIDYMRLNASTRKDHFPLPILLFSRWIFRIFPNPYTSRRSRKDHLYMPLRNIRIPQNATRSLQCPYHFPTCMMSIFTYMIEAFMEVFMDDFSVYGSSFKNCLENLCKILARCEEKNLVLNWEKCHFMVSD